MILRQHLQRLQHPFTRVRRGGPDEGAALVAVLGIALVIAIVSTSMASMVLANTGHTADVRSSVRAQAAADAGLDGVLHSVDGKTFGQLASVCGGTTTVDGMSVQVTTSYTLSTGAKVSCPTASQAPLVTSLLVTSTATDRANLGRDAVQRTVATELRPTPPSATLDHAIFGESSFVITNDADIKESATGAHDAHIYTNGALECKTQAVVEGQVYAAQGDVILWDRCDVASTVWASGTVLMKSQTSVDGDVYAASSASPYSVILENSSAEVYGNVLTNGGVRINGTNNRTQGSVHGSVFARTGGIRLENSAVIGGSGYARLGIHFQNGGEIRRDALSLTGAMTRENSNNKVGGYARAGGTIDSSIAVGGARQAGQPGLAFPAALNPSTSFPASTGFPTAIQPPAREQFPRLLATQDEYALWESSGWDVLRFTGMCGTSVMNEIKKDRPKKTMLVFAGCTSPIVLDSNATTLNSDRAIVSESGFGSSNNMNFSVQGNGSAYLYLIVPAYAPGITWTTLPNGQTKPSCTSGLKSTIDRFKPKDIEVLIYTPCEFQWVNMHPNMETYVGQIYAGGVSLPPSFQMQMGQIPVPGLSDGTPNPSAPVDMQLAGRYDVPS